MFQSFSSSWPLWLRNHILSPCCLNWDKSWTAQPFNCQIKFVILLTVNHTIIKMLVQRIWYWINLSPNWYFTLFSSLIWLIVCCSIEKFCLGHWQELKVKGFMTHYHNCIWLVFTLTSCTLLLPMSWEPAMESASLRAIKPFMKCLNCLRRRKETFPFEKNLFGPVRVPRASSSKFPYKRRDLLQDL